MLGAGWLYINGRFYVSGLENSLHGLLFWALLWLAFIGFVFYLILRLFSPSTADQLRDMIKGKPAL